MKTNTAKKLSAQQDLYLGRALVREAELAKLVRSRVAVEAAAATLSSLRKALAVEEQEMIARLQNGAHVEAKSHLAAEVETNPGRCSPSWKSEFEKMAAKAGMDPQTEVLRVQEATPTTLRFDLVIAER